MSSHRTCRKENSSQLDAFSYSFVSFPNRISPVPYVKGCVELQPRITSTLRFSQRDTLHTPMHEGPAPRWSWGRFGAVVGWRPYLSQAPLGLLRVFSLASLEEGQAKRQPLPCSAGSSLLAPGEISAAWGKCRASRDCFTLSLATSWAGTSIVPHPAWQAKELSSRLSSHQRSHMALSKSWEEK